MVVVRDATDNRTGSAVGISRSLVSLDGTRDRAYAERDGLDSLEPLVDPFNLPCIDRQRPINECFRRAHVEDAT